MSQQQVAAQVANLLGKVGRWSVLLGIGGSVLQTSLYTGEGRRCLGLFPLPLDFCVWPYFWGAALGGPYCLA